jgi:[CysO sulfur-carrier protein]-S-L-cysteine hydrolase
MISRLSISADQYREMLEHVSLHAPLEACGLLAGRDARVQKVIPVRNQAESPVRFVMDPYEQLQAFEWIELQSLDLLGIYHSHPAGPETVSATDIREAAYAVVHLIWSRNGDAWNIRGFWIEHGQVQEVSLSLEE